MAKGQIAKENVTKVIADAFGENFVGEFDKKLYVWANDGSEKVQIAIALTCPKVYRGIEETAPTALNFEDDEPEKGQNAATGFQPAEITQEEQDTLAELMAKLGL